MLSRRNYLIATGVAAVASPQIAKASSHFSSLSIFEPGDYLVTEDLVMDQNIHVLEGAKFVVSDGKTLTLNGSLQAGLYQIFELVGSGRVKFGPKIWEANPYWFGAKVDNSTDDSKAWNDTFLAFPWADPNDGGGSIVVPRGRSRIMSPIDIPKGATWTMKGFGNSSQIFASGCDAFTIRAGGLYGTVFEDFRIIGDNSAGQAAFNIVPDVPTAICAGVLWRNVLIGGCKIAWNAPDMQLCSFEHCQVDIHGGAVFYMDTNGGYGQSNSNRIHDCHFMGSDSEIFDFTLYPGQNRAVDWVMRDCDIQFTGDVIPITIKDMQYTIEKCEFENSTADNLILLTADDRNLPQHTVLSELILTGGGANGNGKIRIESIGSQQPYFTMIQHCNSGAQSTILVDIQKGNTVVLMNNRGAIGINNGQKVQIISGDGA